MTGGAGSALPAVLEHSPVRVVFGAGELARLGTEAANAGARQVLLVSDPGVVAAGHVGRAVESLRKAGVEAIVFGGARENPTTEHVNAGVEAARRPSVAIDLIVGLGGGSAMDCAKGINLLLCCGGEMADFRGDPGPEVVASRPPLLPTILVPTTAGTGSEAQSFALISDAQSRQKMACGDRRRPAEGGLRPRVAILDPDLLRTVPRDVAAMTAIDAVSHAVESAASAARTEVSRAFSRAAWDQLDGAFERMLCGAADGDARAEMLLGAHLAGAAIENAMLGVAHACANPLTAGFGVVHGVAVGVMLPHVVRFNAAEGDDPYADLAPAEALAARIEAMLDVAGLPRRLRDVGVQRDALPALAASAAQQWTAGFNPRPVRAAELERIYAAAF